MSNMIYLSFSSARALSYDQAVLESIELSRKPANMQSPFGIVRLTLKPVNKSWSQVRIAFNQEKLCRSLEGKPKY